MLFIISLVVLIWIYHDCLRWRLKGVNVYPGLVVSAYLFVSFFLGSPLAGLLEPPQIGDIFQILIALLPLWTYLIIRSTVFKKKARLGSPPLPPAPRWSFWVMILLLLAPVFFIAFFLLSFGNSW